MLLLDVPLPDLPDIEGLPVLEKDVLREPRSLGSGVGSRGENWACVGEVVWLAGELDLPLRYKAGMSAMKRHSSVSESKVYWSTCNAHLLQPCQSLHHIARRESSAL